MIRREGRTDLEVRDDGRAQRFGDRRLDDQIPAVEKKRETLPVSGFETCSQR